MVGLTVMIGIPLGYLDFEPWSEFQFLEELYFCILGTK